MGAVVGAGEINFTGFPAQLVDKLMLPSLWVGELLATIIVLMICLIPFAIFGKLLITLMVGFIVLFFATAIGWIDGWIMIIISMLVSGIFSFGLFKDMLGD